MAYLNFDYRKIVKQEIASIEALGVTIETNVVVGKTITMEEIMSEFDACYLSVGAGHQILWESQELV